MKKKVFVAFFLIMISLLAFTSCASGKAEDPIYKAGESMPILNPDVSQMGGLGIEVIGVVRATSKIALEPDRNGEYVGNSRKYAMLPYANVDTWHNGIFETQPKAFAIAIRNASYELIDHAKENGATFLMYPSFEVDFVTHSGMITVTTQATACKFKNI